MSNFLPDSVLCRLLSVRGMKPGTQIDIPEAEIMDIAEKAYEVFL